MILAIAISARQTVGVSSTTGEGLSDFYEAVREARQEYIDDYRPELEKVVQERAEKKEKDKKAQLEKLMKDMNLAKDKKAQSSKQQQQEEMDDESDVEPSYDGDGQLLDPVSAEAMESKCLLLTLPFSYSCRIPTRTSIRKMISFHHQGCNLGMMAAHGQSLIRVMRDDIHCKIIVQYSI